MADVLRLRNLTFFAHHGLLAEEATLGQRFEIDVELRLDLGPAGRADDPDRTVDYAQVCDTVTQVVTQRRFGLLEALAEAVAAAILDDYPEVEVVVVRGRKPHPPVAAHFEGLEVEIERRRA